MSTMSENKIYRLTLCVELVIQQDRIDKPTNCFKTKQHKTANKKSDDFGGYELPSKK